MVVKEGEDEAIALESALAAEGLQSKKELDGEQCKYEEAPAAALSVPMAKQEQGGEEVGMSSDEEISMEEAIRRGVPAGTPLL